MFYIQSWFYLYILLYFINFYIIIKVLYCCTKEFFLMMSQSNQNKVKQDIVSYILHNDAFSQVQSGKFWKDLKAALKLEQNYVSLKSLFFLAILKDIKNQHPIYSMTEAERRKFVALMINTKKPLEDTQIPDFLSSEDSSYYRNTASENRNVNDAKGARVLPSFLKTQNTPKEANNKRIDRKSQSQNRTQGNNLDDICSYNTLYPRDSFVDSFVSYTESNQQKQKEDVLQITNDDDDEIEIIRETFRTIMEKGYNERMLIDYSNPNWIDLIYQDNNDIDECELPVYDIPHLKRKGSQNKTKTRKRNSPEKISSLTSNKRSKLNDVPLIPPVLLSSTRVEQEKRSARNGKTMKNATNTLHSTEASSRDTNLVTERITSPISTQLNIEAEEMLNNNENESGDRVSVMDADLNEFGSPRSTQDLYMQADIEINKEGKNAVTQNNNHLPFKSNNVTIGNVTKNLKTTSRGGIQNGQLKFNREELRKDTYISNLLNILIKHTSKAANKSGIQKSTFIELDEDNLYLDISNLSDIDISLIPGSQELFDWMKSGNSEEPTANENVAGSTLGDISEFKLKDILKKSHIKKKNRKEKHVVQENTNNAVSTAPAPAPAPSTESQELDLVNNEIANFLGNMKKTTVNPAERVIDTPVNNVKDMLEPPKAPVNSSFDQVCAIEDITDGSINRRKLLRKRSRTKCPNVVQLLKVRTKSPDKVKRTRKRLYTNNNRFTLDEDGIVDIVQYRKDEYRLVLENQGKTQDADNYFPIDNKKYTKTDGTGSISQKYKRYSQQESKTLLAFLIEGDRFKQIRSDETWQKIAQLWTTFLLCNPKLPHSPRDHLSLKNHYFRTVLPNISKYGLTQEQIHLLKSYSRVKESN